MKTVTITLGEKEYTVNELPTRKNEAWRQQLMAQFTEIADLIQGAPTMTTSLTAESIASLVRTISAKVVGSVDILTGLLFDYAPALASDRARIEEDCYESELMDAFTKVLTLAFPFGSLVNRLLSLSGSASTPTSPSLPSANGGSGRKTSTPSPLPFSPAPTAGV